jgi:Phosphoribosyl transferase domain
MFFADRVDAGRRLATRLQHLRPEPVVVLDLPRGGVPVASEVARALGAPLDVIVVRKLGGRLSHRSWAWAPSARTASGSSTTGYVYLFCDEPGRHLPLRPSQRLSHDSSHTA